METGTQTLSGNTAQQSAPTLPETPPAADTAAQPEPIRIDLQPTASAPATPKTCSNKDCGVVGPHAEPAEGTTCIVCEKPHGSTVSVIDRQNGKMVDRKVLVFHSGELVRDDQGLWQAQPTCTLCSADLKCATFVAQKAAKKGERKPLMPRFWTLQSVIDEAAHRNAIDAERKAEYEARRERNAAIDAARERFQAEVAKRGRGFEGAVLRRFERNRSAGLNAAIDAELSDLQSLDALVVRFGSWVRPIVFAKVTATRCSIPEAVAAVEPGIQAEVARKRHIDDLVARGYHRTEAPRGQGNGRRPEPRREARGPLPEAPREPKAGERGGPRREKGDRRRRNEGGDTGGVGQRTKGGAFVMADDGE